MPSSRTILLAVSHFVLRSRRGSGRWKEVPSKVVMASSLERGCMGCKILIWLCFRGRVVEGIVFLPSSYP